jgi:hypothetical protein
LFVLCVKVEQAALQLRKRILANACHQGRQRYAAGAEQAAEVGVGNRREAIA